MRVQQDLVQFLCMSSPPNKRNGNETKHNICAQDFKIFCVYFSLILIFNEIEAIGKGNLENNLY